MNNLELIDTKELITELSKRFDALIVCGEKDETNAEDVLSFSYFGGTCRNLGMIERLKYKILREE